MKEGYHRLELHKTIWEVPEKYKNLAGIGSGAYGQVTIDNISLYQYWTYQLSSVIAVIDLACFVMLQCQVKSSMVDN